MSVSTYDTMYTMCILCQYLPFKIRHDEVRCLRDTYLVCVYLSSSCVCKEEDGRWQLTARISQTASVLRKLMVTSVSVHKTLCSFINVSS